MCEVAEPLRCDDTDAPRRRRKKKESSECRWCLHSAPRLSLPSTHSHFLPMYLPLRCVHCTQTDTESTPSNLVSLRL